MEKTLREAERRLQAAQLAGDVQTLELLLDDRLIFTFGADTFTKAYDLELPSAHTIPGCSAPRLWLTASGSSMRDYRCEIR
ncbi:nuclear transport factor 2 family protein [Nocardia sp. NBC_00565]|uniref:hypothetical protein n=1 Tax=Nocardia sp. NBC_00565 TaxID=2975993 RepID=UPI002E811210|nr:hypothetical protein [Nocardia sp. NBC_00565]WUC06888.1 nuclear transport factor 2 family protein [Nocardia sp. NBC_00565]